MPRTIALIALAVVANFSPAHADSLIEADTNLDSSCARVLSVYDHNLEHQTNRVRIDNTLFFLLVIVNAHVNATTLNMTSQTCGPICFRSAMYHPR